MSSSVWLILINGHFIKWLSWLRLIKFNDLSGDLSSDQIDKGRLGLIKPKVHQNLSIDQGW